MNISFPRCMRLLVIFLLPAAVSYSQGPRKVDMSDFFGVNAFKGDESPKDISESASWIRDYSQWTWLQPEKNVYRFKNALDSIDYDAYYRRLDSFNIRSLFVVQQTPKWISAGKNTSHPEHYAPSGEASGLKPEHYREAASFYYQLAARYGSRKVASRNLLTDDKGSGLDLMDVIEVYNEPDGTWGNQITPAQYAALLNAVYDGNQHKLKGNYGIRSADPDMKVSIGGLAYNLEPLKKIVAAAGRIPFDIVNVHFYTFRYAREKFRVTAPPEWSSLESDMKEVVEWSRKEAGGRPVWLTEIGFDTKPYSPEYVSEQEAANYLIRSYLIALGAGVEKCFWFIFRDLDDTEKPIVFSSSGLFENDTVRYQGATRLKPKLTYWYNATFRNLVKNYFFDPAQQTPNAGSGVHRYDFISVGDQKKLSVLWYCPEYEYDWKPLSTKPSSVNYVYTSPGAGWKISKIVRPEAGTFSGRAERYTEKQGEIALSLNATPVFVEWERNGK